MKLPEVTQSTIEVIWAEGNRNPDTYVAAQIEKLKKEQPKLFEGACMVDQKHKGEYLGVIAMTYKMLCNQFEIEQMNDGI